MSWAAVFPEELVRRPMAFVGLVGLNLTYNAVHKAVWDAFCNNRRQDRVPLCFKALSADHEFLKSKTKRTSYEWYLPKGLLKSGWMRKHLDELPAVVVIFFELDWDEPAWRERQMECATRVEVLRSALNGRNTKLAVVLIQRRAPLPPGEDVQANERAQALCSACQLSAKNLFVLPHTDHLHGYIIRLENAFYELANSYYYAEAKHVKGHREHLNKISHQLLFIRHQFKIAFFNELKQDTHVALKHYKQCYGNILELRMHEAHMLEVKTVAGFVSYKISRISFAHNTPLDAIAQFRKHTDFFRGRVGPPQLAFEHNCWMSKQFEVFGVLFREAVRLGLVAVQWQHPGFYYQEAAKHGIARRRLAHQLCQSDEELASSALEQGGVLESLNLLDFYGQRPWRQGLQSIDPPDLHREQLAVSALQALEIRVAHSTHIIPLLTSAVTAFKKYKSPRTTQWLTVQIGEEHAYAGQFSEALHFLGSVTDGYRREGWWNILTSVLSLALRCAYLIADRHAYLELALELCAEVALRPVEERARIQTNIMRIVQGIAPEPEPLGGTGWDALCTWDSNAIERFVELAQQRWTSTLAGLQPLDTSASQSITVGSFEQSLFTADMNRLKGALVECKPCFSLASTPADKRVRLHVFLRITCPNEVEFEELSVLFSNAVHNISLKKTSLPSHITENMVVKPDLLRCFTFELEARAEDVAKLLHVTAVALRLGGAENAEQHAAILHWTFGGAGGGCTALADLLTTPALSGTSSSSANVIDTTTLERLSWFSVPLRSTISLLEPTSHLELTIQHHAPALVNEFYALQVCAVYRKSDLGAAITDLMLSAVVDVEDAPDSKQELDTHLSVSRPDFDGKVVSHRLGHHVTPSLAENEQVFEMLYMKCFRPGRRSLIIRIEYKLPGRALPAVSEIHVQVTVVLPFELNARLLCSTTLQPVDTAIVGEDLLLQTQLRSISPWPLELLGSDLKLNPQQLSEAEHTTSQLVALQLQRLECAAECRALQVSADATGRHLAPGIYTVFWRRLQTCEQVGEEIPVVATMVTLSPVPLEHTPLSVRLSLPSYGTLHDLVVLTYMLENKTPYPQEVEAVMDPAEGFIFSGNRQQHVRILPHACHELCYNVYPLLTGAQQLPQLHVKFSRHSDSATSMTDLVLRGLPTILFVAPCGRHKYNPKLHLSDAEQVEEEDSCSVFSKFDKVSVTTA